MTTMPAPVGVLARAACAMKRVPSAEVRCRSYVLAEPPAIGRIGGRESLSTHIGASRQCEVSKQVSSAYEGPAPPSSRRSPECLYRHDVPDGAAHVLPPLVRFPREAAGPEV